MRAAPYRAYVASIVVCTSLSLAGCPDESVTETTWLRDGDGTQLEENLGVGSRVVAPRVDSPPRTPPAADQIIVHEARVDTSERFTLVYSKNFDTCVHILEKGSSRIAHSYNFFCERGEDIVTTVPLEYFGFLRNTIRACHGNNHNICSADVTVSAPSHPLSFYLQCDLGAAVSSELGEPSFNCEAPSALLMSTLSSRLAQYTTDLSIIFAKQTFHRFAFDPSRVFLRATQPHNNNGGSTNQFGGPIWIWALRSPIGNTGGGYAGSDTSGARVLADLGWDKVHDPALVQDGTPAMEQYWRQLWVLAHEAEHAFGGGNTEYYSFIMVTDPTGIAPIENIHPLDTSPGSFWQVRSDYFGDPLLWNVWNQPMLGQPKTRAALFAAVWLSDVSAAIVNNRWFSGANNLDKLPDLAHVQIVVRNAQNGQAIPNARVRGFTVDRTHGTTPSIADAYTNAAGEVVVSFNCAAVGCASNFEHLKIFKVSAPGYQPGSLWQTIFDAQEARMVRFKTTLRLEIRLSPQ